MPVGRDQELGEDRADEAGRAAEPQPGEDHRARRRQDDLEDDLPARAEEGAAHLDQRVRRVAHGGERVQHDHRHRHDADDEHLGGEADAIGEDDERDQRGERRRLRDDEDRRGEPFGQAVEAHGDAERDARNDRGDEAESERLQRDAKRLDERDVGEHPNSAAMVSEKVGKAGLIGKRPAIPRRRRR